MKFWVPLMVMAAVVAGCTDNKNRLSFDGQFYRVKVAKVDRQRDVFTVTVRDVSQSLVGARGAALHAGNSYCVENYGSSDIAWAVGPETPDGELRIVDDRLVYQGICPQL